ncbi:unnamed protein product, partial [marine sediment metagenome]
LQLGMVPITTLRVTADIAKNKTERLVPLSDRIQQVIKAMSNWWWEQDRSGNHYAFYRGDNSNQHITTRQVERIIRKAAMTSLGRPVHPHVLRHTFASRLMRTTNARIVQELLGHQHLGTTQIYTHPNQDDLKKAIETLEGENVPADPQGQDLSRLSDIANGTDTVTTDRDMG